MSGGPTRQDEDFAREIDAHLQIEADRLVEEGFTPDAARLEARRRFGNPTRVREQFFYSRRSLWFDHLKQDVRTAVRGIRRYPIACAIAVISLAGGIGATTATLVMRDAVFLAPPPLYADPTSLYRVSSPTLRVARRQVPAGLYRTWLEDAAIRNGLAAAAPARQQDVRDGDRTGSASIRPVTPELFTRLGVRPAMGTLFDEWRAGGAPPAILSHTAWQRLMDGRGDVIGKAVLIDDVPHMIAAVMPERFWFGAMDGPVWTVIDPATLMADTLVDVVVRRPEAMPEAAMFERLLSGADRFAATLPSEQRQLRAHAELIRGTPLGNMVGPFVLIVLGAAVFLTLLIACTNVAVLMMAQWTAREHEIAIRASLGGARGRIVRSLLTESTLIAVAGGLLGVATTFALRGLFIRNVATANLYDMTVHPTVILQSSLLTLAVGVLTGVAPAIYETRRLHVNPLSAIRGSDRVRQRWRHALVVLEIATTVALLVTAGAMLSSYSKSLTGDPGFDTVPMLSADASDADGVDVRAVLDRLRSIPGVAAAEVATSVPFIAPCCSQPVSGDATAAPLTMRASGIGPHYFTTLGVRMLSGRAFSERDTAGGDAVAIVNEVAAAQLWSTSADNAHGGAIGRQVFVAGRPYQVVGVVAGYAVTAVQPARPMVFTPFAQLQPPPTRAEFMIRASGDAAALTQSVRRELLELGGGVVVSSVVTMEQIKQIIGQEIIVSTYPLFPLIATGMLLTAAGIYGVLAFAVTRRSTELAVRIAVGASNRDLLRLVAAHSFRMLGLGTAIGIALTYALTRIAQGRGGFFDSPGWRAFVVPMLMIAAIAALATVIPMLRALRINPSSLLRTT